MIASSSSSGFDTPRIGVVNAANGCLARYRTPAGYRCQSEALKEPGSLAIVGVDEVSQAVVLEDLAIVALAVARPVRVLVQDFHEPVGVLVAVLVRRTREQIGRPVDDPVEIGVGRRVPGPRAARPGHLDPVI